MYPAANSRVLSTLYILFSIQLIDSYSADVADPPFYKTLIYGEKLKGFVSISPADNNGSMYFVTFDIKEKPPGSLVWSVHMSSAPYDMAVMTDNCRRVKKSPPVVKNKPLSDSTITADGLAGNTLVISGDNSEVLACATVILPGTDLRHAVFHAEPIEGHVHIITLKNNLIRLVPDLKYMQKYANVEPVKAILTWAFVDECNQNATQHTDYSEIGVDSRATFVYEIPQNISLHYLAIFQSDQLYSCALIQTVEPRTVKALGVTLSQEHYFDAVRALEYSPNQLNIRDDCLDISTETIHNEFHSYYPSVNIFGSESILLKSLVHKNRCSVLRPRFSRPVAIANFIHPMIGRISLVDTDDKVLLTGEIRNLFDEISTRATIVVSNKTTSGYKCAHMICEDCPRVENAAVIVGKNEPAVSMTGVFDWFNISDAKSIIVDLDWMKVCANATKLPTGALTMHALIKRFSPFHSPTVASIVALEYPANNYTEIIINKKQIFSEANAHYRPIDRTITTGPPCGEKNLGAITNVSWIDDIKINLGKEFNDSSLILDENFVTGSTSMIGTSVILKDGKQVYCGHFEPLSERTIVFAEFNEPLQGYIKLTQYAESNWEVGYPTEVYYSLNYKNDVNPRTNPERIYWEVVNMQNMTCKSSIIFNPFHANETECTPQRHELCPIGSAANRSKPMLMHARYHLTAQMLPLSGPYSVVGKHMRIRSANNNIIGCYPLVKVSEASFRWTVLSNLTLVGVQKAISKRCNVPIYKVEVDYTREFYKGKCTIYWITILEEDHKLEKILDEFDVEQNRFKSDNVIDCGEGVQNEESVTEAPEIETQPPKILQSSSTILSSFVTFIIIARLFIF
ncbi:unnamed protein product [Caenorhabditis bovis]|uniref:Uncharacterized protein n=1 Tax=Caenorhabditis bovis TaxID=2654633 RepID=A0A8S1EIM3_9PELO|nr:unnamed protein product [Caenorhabditis bovis]